MRSPNVEFEKVLFERIIRCTPGARGLANIDFAEEIRRETGWSPPSFDWKWDKHRQQYVAEVRFFYLRPKHV